MKTKMKALSLVIIIAQILFASSAGASGIFPKAETIFGVYLPAASNALKRTANAEEKRDSIWKQTFLNVTEEEYYNFGKYLSYLGYEVIEIEKENDLLTVTAERKSYQFYISYAWSSKTMIVTYPEGTRPEESKKDVAFGFSEEIFPSLTEYFVPALPSIEVAIGRKSDQVNTVENQKTQQIYYAFSDEEYQKFSTYLSGCDVKIINYSVDGNVVKVDIKKDEYVFQFLYDRAAKKATVIYPRGTRAEKK